MLATIVGKRGKGKTTLAREIVLGKNSDRLCDPAGSPDYDRVFILDCLGEFLDLASERIKVVLFDEQNYYLFLREVWDQAGNDHSTLLVLDEVHLYGKENPTIKMLYRLGRHWRLDILAIGHRFADLPVITRSLTTKFYLFQITEPIDVDYLRRIVSPEILRLIMTLPDFKYTIVRL